MASLGDLFNPSFLIFLGILVLVAALLVVYFESKMRDQNHKIASMISLVSTLAEDMNNIKFGMNQLAVSAFNGGSINQFNNNSRNLNNNDNDDDDNDDDNEDNDDDNDENNDEKKLITVSDDSDSDDDDDSDSDDESHDSESKSGSVIDLNSDIESDKNSEIDEIDEIDDANNNIKILKLDIKSDLFENIEENNDLEDLEELEVLEEEILDNLSDSQSVNFDANNDELTNELINELTNDLTNNINETHIPVQENSDANLQISESTLKSININLEESNNESHDYKKLSLTKLRSIVVEKGLSTDTSKLKKQDLLKLLGVE